MFSEKVLFIKQSIFFGGGMFLLDSLFLNALLGSFFVTEQMKKKVV